MSLRTVLQLDNGTDGLASLVGHLEGLRHLSYLQRVDDTCHVLRQILHLELRRTSALRRVGHQTVVVTRVLVIGDIGGSLLEGKFLGPQIVADRVEAHDSLTDSLIADNRLAQNMTHVHLVAALVNELDDMIAELRLHNLRYLLRVGQSKSDGGEVLVEDATPGIA